MGYPQVKNVRFEYFGKPVRQSFRVDTRPASKRPQQTLRAPACGAASDCLLVKSLAPFPADAGRRQVKPRTAIARHQKTQSRRPTHVLFFRDERRSSEAVPGFCQYQRLRMQRARSERRLSGRDLMASVYRTERSEERTVRTVILRRRQEDATVDEEEGSYHCMYSGWAKIGVGFRRETETLARTQSSLGSESKGFLRGGRISAAATTHQRQSQDRRRGGSRC